MADATRLRSSGSTIPERERLMDDFVQLGLCGKAGSVNSALPNRSKRRGYVIYYYYCAGVTMIVMASYDTA
jgi:hypothetical protein